MKILFIGGTGIISSACSELAVDYGYELTLLNRGKSERLIPIGAHVIYSDIRDPESVRAALGKETFDVVVDWIAFTPEHIETDLELFRGRVGQYVFISSASVYQKPIARLPITESTPLKNPFWQYSRNKIACEERLVQAYREDDFPITIIRPSHTYDKTLLPFHNGYTWVDRMRRGQKVIVHGDGTSLWVLTHHEDFARGFVPLLGNPHALGEDIQITSDEILTWDQIFSILARQSGGSFNPVYAPSELIAAFDPEWGASLLGDKAHSVIFDNTKLKRLVPDYQATIPFERGAAEIMEWYDADPSRQVVDEGWNALLDRIIAACEGARPGS